LFVRVISPQTLIFANATHNKIRCP